MNKSLKLEAGPLRRIGGLFAIAVLLIASTSATAAPRGWKGADCFGSKCTIKPQQTHWGHGYGYNKRCGYRHVDVHSPRYQYKRGLRQGRRAGWARGFDDAECGRPFCVETPRLRRCSPAFRAGFRAGFAQGYHNGFYSECYERSPRFERPRHRGRRH